MKRPSFPSLHGLFSLSRFRSIHCNFYEMKLFSPRPPQAPPRPPEVEIRDDLSEAAGPGTAAAAGPAPGASYALRGIVFHHGARDTLRPAPSALRPYALTPLRPPHSTLHPFPLAGRSLSSGHYTAAVRNDAIGGWVHVDDAVAQKVPSSDLFSEQPQAEGYLLFYEHRADADRSSTDEEVIPDIPTGTDDETCFEQLICRIYSFWSLGFPWIGFIKHLKAARWCSQCPGRPKEAVNVKSKRRLADTPPAEAPSAKQLKVTPDNEG